MLLVFYMRCVFIANCLNTIRTNVDRTSTRCDIRTYRKKKRRVFSITKNKLCVLYSILHYGRLRDYKSHYNWYKLMYTTKGFYDVRPARHFNRRSLRTNRKAIKSDTYVPKYNLIYYIYHAQQYTTEWWLGRVLIKFLSSSKPTRTWLITCARPCKCGSKILNRLTIF